MFVVLRRVAVISFSGTGNGYSQRWSSVCTPHISLQSPLLFLPKNTMGRVRAEGMRQSAGSVGTRGWQHPSLSPPASLLSVTHFAR